MSSTVALFNQRSSRKDIAMPFTLKAAARQKRTILPDAGGYVRRLYADAEDRDHRLTASMAVTPAAMENIELSDTERKTDSIM